MMSQTEDAEDSELQVEKQTNADPLVKEDEQLDGLVLSVPLVSNNSELADPAILAVREIPKLRYSKDELIKLRENPLSMIKPDCANIDLCQKKSDSDHRKTITPTDSERPRNEQQQPDNRRRIGDPRERLRKESDGIVLSPQRRSFNSGCYVPQNRSAGPRPHSPIGAGAGKGDATHVNVREIQAAGNRRIGSGRILRDSWDFNSEKAEANENEYHRGIQDDRRSFRRDFDMSRENKDRRNNGNRYGGRRVSGGDKDEEPEWFSGGPLSQNDTIELRGFDEPEKAVGNSKKKTVSSSQAKRVREWAKKKSDTLEEKPGEEMSESGQQQNPSAINERGSNATPTLQDGGGAGKGTSTVRNEKDLQQNDNDKENRNLTNNAPSTGGMEIINEQSFLFDDIFKCDTIPGLLTNGVEGATDNNTKSRFSRWFKHESPEKATESRRSSLQEEHLLKNLLNDINEPATVTIPPQLGNAESYFAPISPAAINAGGGDSGALRPGQVNIAEMFQRGKREQNAGPQGEALNNMKSQFPGKVMSLNELESRMRKGADISGNHIQGKAQIKKEDDMSAFKRLLAQVSGGHVVTANNGMPPPKMPPMSLMEMLSHSQQQEEVQARLNQQSHMVGGGNASPKPTPIGPTHNDFLLKMQQAAQQEQQAQLHRQQQVNMLNKLMGLHPVASHMRASPLQDLAQQQSKELLSRPEAQAILQGLKRGDITPQHLYQQLANPALQPRHREMLYAILKMQRMGPSPRVLSPVSAAQHTQRIFAQQVQQCLRVSPLPPNAFCVSPIMATSPNTLTVPAMHQRIPSPRELQVHTQNILQRALIKKKLEEQQENFRKKQEMQQPGHSPNSSSNKNVSSPTPLAFTPTSVLRKMTADKEDGNNKDAKNQDASKFPQGRAVVGARIQQQNQQTNQWNNQYLSKQPGRPIVKANSTYQNSGAEQFFNAHPQQFLFNQQQRQQQGGHPQHATTGQQQGGNSSMYGQQQKQPQQTSGIPPMGNIGQYSNQSNQQPQQFPQLTQQQLRAQHQQQSRPVAAANQQAQTQQPNQQPPQQKSQNFNNQPQHQQQNTAWQQFLNAAAQQNNRNQTGRGVAGDGDLSPTTSNQLARWFSSDLLERARGGELPSTAGLAQHAVSLEEIERQTAPPVHN